MKLTSVELHPSGSADICVLSFRDPRRANPYNVKGIVGLDADEIVARRSGSSTRKSPTLQKRDIVIRVDLNPAYGNNETNSQLRDRLYRLISSSRTGLLEVHFKNGNTVVAAVSGFVSKFEAPHFERQPEVQITVSCDDPMLRALTPVAVDISNLDPSLTTIQDNLSTAPHGFKFELSFTDNMATFSMLDPNDDEWFFNVTPVDGFDVGDVLHMSSEHNNKYLYIVRGVETIHLVDAIQPGSEWPILFPGSNQYSIGFGEDVEWESITHLPAYWGV